MGGSHEILGVFVAVTLDPIRSKARPLRRLGVCDTILTSGLLFARNSPSADYLSGYPFGPGPN
jgi:hypothetical protein